MKTKLTALLLALALLLGAAGCGAQGGDAAAPRHSAEPLHKIGVIVYNTGDEEVIGFREYLQGYIESNFEMVKFVYSDSIRSAEEELAFIQNACDEGVEGFLSFLSHDLAADNPWFLGMFGPGRPFEFQAGADMARFFIGEELGTRYFVLSGGAPLGNEMHYQRTLGILDAFASAYGVAFPASREELAASDRPVTVETDRLTVTICPGYVSREEYLETARESFAAGSYDAVLSVLPPADLAMELGGTPLGVVDSYHTRNLQLFTNGVLKFVEGKYSSLVGPAFALMLNAVTGYAADFRDNGRALQVTQGFWKSESMEDYQEKYALSSSAAKNAYNFDDLSAVIRIYNPDADLNALIALAEACSYHAVEARRSASPAQ